ncbi:hypothetical protein CK203_101231 [Vitis vinifera]|uniref:Uncharacterized protein n=1 Tax=Vitis vinifera TaxID=29760 RepID=A0A438DC55_VITVI|nr:hypothetical protein CK203_101231 [Vitis vinifera]
MSGAKPVATPLVTNGNLKLHLGALRVTHVSSADQLADALTKPLPRSRFQELRVKIGVSSEAPS